VRLWAPFPKEKTKKQKNKKQPNKNTQEDSQWIVKVKISLFQPGIVAICL
jgi:predicted HTH domain antitoxin